MKNNFECSDCGGRGFHQLSGCFVVEGNICPYECASATCNYKHKCSKCGGSGRIQLAVECGKWSPIKFGLAVMCQHAGYNNCPPKYACTNGYRPLTDAEVREIEDVHRFGIDYILKTWLQGCTQIPDGIEHKGSQVILIPKLTKEEVTMNMLTDDRNTPMRDGAVLSVPAAGGKKFFAGGMAAINSAGYAVPASSETGLRGSGRIESNVDNSAGADNNVVVAIRKGIFRYDNDVNAPISRKSIGGICFMVDDHTVSCSEGGSKAAEEGKMRGIAGAVFDVDTDGVWVRFF